VLCLALAAATLADSSVAGLRARGVDQTVPPPACDRFATPTGNDQNRGSRRSPYATASKLVASLHGGQTGCLIGRFEEYVRFDKGGSVRRRITLRSAPGQQATICGHIYVTPRAAHWRLSRLKIDGSCSTQDTILVFADDVILDHNDITNGYRGRTCVVIGSHSYGEGVVDDALVSHNRIHDCGLPLSGHTHAVYINDSKNARITDNYIYRADGFSVQLYPDAQQTLITRNVIDKSLTKSGVVLAGESPYASSNNLVIRNIITRNEFYGVFRSWAGPIGTGNLVKANCFWQNAPTTFPPDPLGFLRSKNVEADPQFIARTPDDYRLRRGSPCKMMHPRGQVGL
jgi:hypothetical protein